MIFLNQATVPQKNTISLAAYCRTKNMESGLIVFCFSKRRRRPVWAASGALCAFTALTCRRAAAKNREISIISASNLIKPKHKSQRSQRAFASWNAVDTA